METNYLDRLVESINNPKVVENLVKALNMYNYKFAVIGGFAVAYYTKNGRGASPEDLDILVFDENFETREKLILDLTSIYGFKIINHGIFFNDVVYSLKFQNQEVDIKFTKSSFNKSGINKSEWNFLKGTKVPFFNKIFLTIDKFKVSRDKDLEDVLHLLKFMNDIEIGQLKQIAKKISSLDNDSLNNLVDFIKSKK